MSKGKEHTESKQLVNHTLKVALLLGRLAAYKWCLESLKGTGHKKIVQSICDEGTSYVCVFSDT